ncbi:MAG TPA: hypothetical protein VGG19_11810 [Tepidisphaeraceae bacterium]|jgi:hypothetical protein
MSAKPQAEVCPGSTGDGRGTGSGTEVPPPVGDWGVLCERGAAHRAKY